MMMINRIVKPLALLLSCALLILSFASSASPVDTFVFNDEATKLRFQHLSKELRCPKCQNQNLSDSNSPIAADLRLIVYNMLQDGKSDSEIVDFMVYRYGEFVLYKPKVNKMTYILWYGPIGLVIIAGIVIFMMLRRRAGKYEQIDQELSAEEQTKLDDLIK